MKAITKNLWAPLVTPERGKPYFSWDSIRASRRECKRAYLTGWVPSVRERVLKRVRFVKVTITEQ